MNSQPNYLREVTNNLSHAKKYLSKNTHIDIACVFCKTINRYFDDKEFFVIGNNNLTCKECNVDSMIPITPHSILYSMSSTYKENQIEEWYNEWFKPLENDGEPEYEDYEYDEYQDSYEETKENPYLSDYHDDEISVPELMLYDINKKNN